MAHAAKYPKGAVGQLCQHYERKQDEKGEYVKFGNKDIDLTRTHENYNLAPDRNQVEFIRQRTSEVQCLNRKDVKVMCSWVVTLPKDFPKEQEREFFQQAYKFLENRYGGEKNIISAYVHMDEATPHMHFAFIPIVEDKKKKHLKVSAKECITKGDLKSFHTDLSRHMEHHFGRDVGILNEATKEGNKAIEELKRESAVERLQQTNEQVQKIYTETKIQAMDQGKKIIAQAQTSANETLNKAENDVQRVREEIKPLENKKQALQGQINALESKLRPREEVLRELLKIDAIEGKKALLGNNVTLSHEEFTNLKEIAKEGVKLISENTRLIHQNKQYKADYEEMRNGFEPLDKENFKLKLELEKVRRDFGNLQNEFQKIKSFIHEHGLMNSFKEWTAKIQQAIGRER